MNKNELDEIDKAFEAEMHDYNRFRETLEREKVENPEFYDTDFELELVNSFLNEHPELSVVELKEKETKR